MKKVTINPTTPEIDWSKPQWVRSEKYPDRIILTTGEHFGHDFTGICMPCSRFPNGNFDKIWDKRSFHLLTEDIPFIISNKD